MPPARSIFARVYRIFIRNPRTETKAARRNAPKGAVWKKLKATEAWSGSDYRLAPCPFRHRKSEKTEVVDGVGLRCITIRQCGYFIASLVENALNFFDFG
jgi:hypothetical protein